MQSSPLCVTTPDSDGYRDRAVKQYLMFVKLPLVFYLSLAQFFDFFFYPTSRGRRTGANSDFDFYNTKLRLVKLVLWFEHSPADLFKLDYYYQLFYRCTLTRRFRSSIPVKMPLQL